MNSTCCVRGPAHAAQPAQPGTACERALCLHLRMHAHLLRIPTSLPFLARWMPADEDLPWPKRYSQLEPPLPEHSVRLLVIPLEDAPRIAGV